LVTQTELRCPVAKIVRAVRWTVVAATPETTHRAVISGATGQHAVVVVILHALVAQSQGNVEAVVPEVLHMHKRGNLRGSHFVVVVLADRGLFNQGWSANSGEALFLKQVAPGVFQVGTKGDQRIITEILVGGQLYTDAAVVIGFCRQPR